jgi:exosome complex component RRP41
MIPFSTKERARPGPSRRSTEISKVITDTFNSVVFLQEFPKTAIDVFVRIIQADAGTRCVAINAVSLALADAGIPMSDLVAACAAGKVDGQLVLDLFGLEDNYGEVDLPIAWLPSSKKIILLQMDGILSIDEFKKALELAKVGCEQVHACQVKALKKKFEGVDLE